jgi:hypothetical protein
MAKVASIVAGFLLPNHYSSGKTLMKTIKVNKECIICCGVFQEGSRDNPDLSQALRDPRVCPECFRRVKLYILLTKETPKPVVVTEKQAAQVEAKKHRGKFAKKNLAYIKETENEEIRKRIAAAQTRCMSAKSFQRTHAKQVEPESVVPDVHAPLPPDNPCETELGFLG